MINPTAGRGSARRVWEQIKDSLDRWGKWEAALTAGPGQAEELARTAAARGFNRVVAVGGDGTLSEVVNGLVGTPVGLGLIPAGTGNDFARVVEIPFHPLRAAELALTRPPRPMDLGYLETTARRTYFLNVAGLGFDAEVAKAVNAFPKYLGGTIPYLLGILKTLWRYTPAPVELEADGRRLDRKVLLAAVGIARAYGGGMLVLPSARLDDGEFDVCIAGEIGRAACLGLVPKLYRGGHVGHPKVEFLRCRELRVQSARPVAVHADGEVVGQLPATFRVHPGALQVIVGRFPD